MFLDTTLDRFLPPRQYEVLIPPTYEVYNQPYNYLNSSGRVWVGRRASNLVAHKGKLFIGSGEYDINTGATPICSYDPITDEWTIEAYLPTEQIYNIREIDDTLWIPCTDHTGPDVDARVFRRKDDGTWETISIPFPARHSFDIIKWDNKIWMDIAQASAAPNNKAAVVVSSDGGVTWNRILCYEADGVTPPVTTGGSDNRVESGFYVFNNELYVIDQAGWEPSAGFPLIQYKYSAQYEKFLRTTNSLLYGSSGNTWKYASFPYHDPNIRQGGGFYVLAKRIDFLFGIYSFLTKCRAELFYSSKEDIKIIVYSHVKHACHYSEGNTGYKYLLPAVNGWSEGQSSKSRVEGTVTHYSKRTVHDVTVCNGRIYILLSTLIDCRSLDSATNFYNWSDIDYKSFMYIYSSSDMVNWRLEFTEQTPSIFPNNLAIIGGYAYISMFGAFSMANYLNGSIYKVRLKSDE